MKIDKSSLRTWAYKKDWLILADSEKKTVWLLPDGSTVIVFYNETSSEITKVVDFYGEEIKLV